MKLSVANRLFLGFLSILLLIVLNNVYVFTLFGKMGRDIDEIVEGNSAQLLAGAELMNEVQGIRMLTRQIILDNSPDDAAKTSEQFTTARTNLGQQLASLEKLLTDPRWPASAEESKLLQEIRAMLPEVLDNTQKTFDLVKQGDRAGAISNNKGVLGKFNTRVTELVQLQKKLSDAKATENHQARVSAQHWLMGLTIAVLLACLTLAWLISRSITQPLNQLQRFIGGLSEHYDFTQRIPVTRHDEIGLSLQSLNSLLDTLQASLRQLGQIGRTVTATAGSLSTASSELSGTSQQVSSAASSMAAGVEEVTVSINHVADRAQECDSTARDAGKMASSGGEVIESTIRGINRIAEDVRASASQIETLKERTASISTVVNVIKEIADQTNLLALNAAIEAARAGEQGRGFAVVADEVRKLAERTGSSTREITSTISAIQNEANTTVEAMQLAVEQVNQGVQQAQQASDAIHHIRQNADRVVEQVSEITNSMREQSAASSMMAQQVERVAQMSEESSALARNTASEGTHLRQLSQELDAAISRYKV
ncbi:methyl-accepting chemotaxis protein [Chitinilyticum aquatile]|uniref:methyl-accepting chemotaxis protein n=1 Tax=Chitinilyticum aquatile TaxID=362520 RepID=UPI00041D967D|nr:methyl-accepting chemotaxis protein [Chitinilyticum aquatile]